MLVRIAHRAAHSVKLWRDEEGEVVLWQGVWGREGPGRVGDGDLHPVDANAVLVHLKLDEIDDAVLVRGHPVAKRE